MILFLTNTFPLDDNLIQGKFNYRAAVQLSAKTPLKIIHLRSWRPWRRIVEHKNIGELKVIVFSFPYYPVLKNNFLQGIQLNLYRKTFKLFLGAECKNIKLVHSVGANFSGVVGSYLSKKNKTPHIAQCIGTDINYNLPRLKNTWGIKGFENYVTYFTGNSKATEKQISRIYPKSKTATIYRGVDLSYFKNSCSTKETKEITFTYLGGLSLRKETGKGRDYKGGVTLLEAWKKLEDYKNLKLNFVGPEVSADLIDDILGEQAKKYNIFVQGLVNSEKVKNLLKETDVIIIPSWAEGLPNAGMEALASGCAIIGTEVGGIPELINSNGFLFKPGDSQKLKELIKQMTADREQLEVMKIQSRKIAETKFDSKQFAEQYLKLYEAI